MDETFTVYGLRFRGEREVRYIGFSRFTPAERLANHLINQSYRPSLTKWFAAHGDKLEAFAIAECETKAQARAMEKVIIALCLRLNQRLMNSDHVPSRLRLVA